MTSSEQGVSFQVSETRLARDVTPREIAERIGGGMTFAGGGFVTAISYEHTKGLQILTERSHGEAREHLSLLRLPVVKGDETSVETILLDDTTTIILRPESVTFGIPIRSERSRSPSQLLEVTITPKGFSYSTLVA